MGSSSGRLIRLIANGRVFGKRRMGTERKSSETLPILHSHGEDKDQLSCETMK